MFLRYRMLGAWIGVLSIQLWIKNQKSQYLVLVMFALGDSERQATLHRRRGLPASGTRAWSAFPASEAAVWALLGVNLRKHIAYPYPLGTA